MTFISVSWPENHTCSLFLTASTAWRRGSEAQFHQPERQKHRSSITPEPLDHTQTHVRARSGVHTHRVVQRNAIECACASHLLLLVCFYFSFYFSPSLSPTVTHAQTLQQKILWRWSIVQFFFLHFFNKFTFSVIQVAFMDSAAGAQTSCWGSLTRACTLNTYTTSYSGCNYLNPSCAPLYKYQFVFYYWHS